MNNSVRTAIVGVFGFTIAAGIAVECSLFALAFCFVVCAMLSLIGVGVLMENL